MNSQSITILNPTILNQISQPNQIEAQKQANKAFERQQMFVDSMPLDHNNPQIHYQKMRSLITNYSFIEDQHMTKSKYYQDNGILNVFNILPIQLIEKLFLIKQPQNNYLWAIWLCIQGEWKLIEVDDDIPCTLRGNQPQLATIQTQLFWPIILEKAIVRSYGQNYCILNQYSTESIDFLIFLLSGLPTQKVATSEMDQLLQVINQQIQIGSICYCVKQDNSFEYGYRIIRIIQENSEYLIELKAASEQNIIYGKNKQNCVGKQFSLTMQEFQQTFVQISVLRYSEDFKFSWIRIKPMQNRKQPQYIEQGYLYEFDIVEDSYEFITICQNELKDQQTQYGLVRLIICQLNQENIEFISGDFNCCQNLTLEIQLTKGHYYILCLTYFLIEQQQNESLVLQFYGNQSPRNIKEANNEQFLDIVKQMFIAFAVSECTQENTRTYESVQQPEIQITTQMNLGMLFFYYRNFGTQILEEQIVFDICENIIDYETLERKTQFKVTVNPCNDYLVLYIFDPVVAWTESPVFQYKCNIKSILHNITASLNQSQIRFNSSIRQNDRFSSTDLIQFMKEKAKMAQRVWDNEPVQIFMYIYQHKMGVVILYLNCGEKVYEEKIILELENLRINCRKDLLHNNQIIFQLEGLSHLFIFLEQIDQKSKFGYKIQNLYKLY